MKRQPLAALLILMGTGMLGPTSHARAAAPATGLPLAPQARALLAQKDYLGFRVLVKKAYGSRLTRGDWHRLKFLINMNSSVVGYDLVALWSARNPESKGKVDTFLDQADQLMLSNRFSEAFAYYQKAAVFLKKTWEYKERKAQHAGTEQELDESRALYPFVLHSMGRALYGAGRYTDALEVYSWITPSYPRFRQVLFEKMWAGFRAGNVEIALGAIASQRSSYFSRFLSPESYLIQIYLYKRLCRTEEIAKVISEMKAYEAALAKGGLSDWAESDTETLVLARLAEAPVPKALGTAATAEREREKAVIRATLQSNFEKLRPKILRDLQTAMAYGQVAEGAESTALQPVREFKSRQELLDQGLEFWPADVAEEWADEAGHHIFMGESLCKAAKR